MKAPAAQLFAYLRAKPARFVHLAILLGLCGWLVIQVPRWLFFAELFAKVVNNPDHRMTKDDKSFNGLNSDNIRSTHEAADMRDEDFNIVFLGDSYIYGFLMSPEKSPPAQLENLLREKYRRNDIKVINFGWTSSSPYLSYRLLQDLGAKYKPDLVLLALDMSDYRDEWFYKSVLLQRGAFYRFVVHFPRTAYLVKQLGETLSPWLDIHTPLWGYAGTGGYFVARQPMEQSLNLFDDIFDSLRQLNNYSQQTLHAPFAVFMPPRHWQYTDQGSPASWENGSFDALGPYALENYRYFEQKSAATPFPLIPLLDAFRNYRSEQELTFKVDSHWNKHGARFFAEQVLAEGEKRGWFTALEHTAE